MKKLITAVLLIALVGTALFSLTACSEEEEDLSMKIEEKVSAYQTDLEDSAGTLTSTEAIKNYLLNWGKRKRYPLHCRQSRQCDHECIRQ